ncbi:MAG: translation initiation factor IF-2 [bacterium]|nr:translation initiation factor IF-2 [bacterium]
MKKPVRRISKKQAKANRKASEAVVEIKPVVVEKPQARKNIEIPAIISVKDFAESMELPVTKVIAVLMKNGVIANINENIDCETAMIIGDEFNFDVVEKKEPDKTTNAPELEVEDDKAKRISRPPVVTIMGHVDHGKTTLLDTIRKTNVASGESGGITQHIGAYQVIVPGEKKKTRLITFLDTPGHAAFSAMRAHGASITDIVVLVVAANDGVKPQTVEAINHAKLAGVPIIVAINKIDLPGANSEKVKQELAERELTPEDWGGKTIMVEISAKTNQNIEELLEMILLVADLKNLTTNPDKKATGVVIESHMQTGVGPLATILINDGILEQSDTLVVGNTYGKIRFMEDFRGRRIKSATASTPVRVAGLNDVPDFGELVISVENEKTARQMTQVKSMVRGPIAHVESADNPEEEKEKSHNIILKTDVQGSLEAIKTSINQMSTAEIKPSIVNEGVGDISESDINMAETTKAVVIGFRVSIKPQVRQLAERKQVTISIYEIIYQLLDDLKVSMSNMLEPEKVEVNIGNAKILKIFLTQKGEQIIGARVENGRLDVNNEIRIIKGGEVAGNGKITSLHRDQDKVETIMAGIECGIGVRSELSIEEGDIIEAFQTEERVRTIE